MSKQLEDGSWLATCPICTWKKTFSKKEEANNNLRNHIDTNHKQGTKKIKDKELLVPPEKMPPQINPNIKEHS